MLRADLVERALAVSEMALGMGRSPRTYSEPHGRCSSDKTAIDLRRTKACSVSRDVSGIAAASDRRGSRTARQTVLPRMPVRRGSRRPWSFGLFLRLPRRNTPRPPRPGRRIGHCLARPTPRESVKRTMPSAETRRCPGAASPAGHGFQAGQTLAIAHLRSALERRWRCQITEIGGSRYTSRASASFGTARVLPAAAMPLAAPQNALEPSRGRPFVRENSHHLDELFQARSGHCEPSVTLWNI